MAKRIGIEVSQAVAEAVKLARAEVISAYPITPQTHIVEDLSQIVANGELEAVFIPVESEHSAMSAAIGSAACGARTYTATSSQGLALMHELMFIASGMRLPVVMTIVNRALSAPINIWNDHSDIMSERDTNWIQIFAENGQEATDLSILAFKIAEHPTVQLPVGINLDGFMLSHVIEPVEFPEQDKVDAFLPPMQPQLTLDPAKPVTLGPVGIPEIYTETKVQGEQAILTSKAVVEQVFKEWGQHFGRQYNMIEAAGCEGAETLFVTMGALGETVMTTLTECRDKPVGQVRIRLWRPFPIEEFRAACRGAKRLIVIDRAMSPGAVRGPVAEDIANVFYGQPDAPEIFNIIAGLGGRDVSVPEFKEMLTMAESGQLKKDSYTVWGVMSNA